MTDEATPTPSPQARAEQGAALPQHSLPLEGRDAGRQGGGIGPAFWPSLVLFLVAFGADRLQKFLQLSVFGWQGGEYVPVTSFFDYVLVWNTGISYGLFATLPVTVLGVLMLVAIVALAFWWWRAREPLLRMGLALCIGGALSNALDRWIYGGVADFFHFHYSHWSFYIFNLADTAITFGVILLVLDFLGLGRRRNSAT